LPLIRSRAFFLLCSVRGRESCGSKSEVIEIPFEDDGGEGTMENMVYATKGQLYVKETSDPLGQSIKASYGGGLIAFDSDAFHLTFVHMSLILTL
jgi:hypothetical protein